MTVLIAGLVILGFAAGSVITPILLELVSAVKDSLGTKPGANEKASALFALFGSIGSILATILGSILYRLLGNRITSDIFAILSFVMAVIFFLANIKPGFLHKKKKADNEERVAGVASVASAPGRMASEKEKRRGTMKSTGIASMAMLRATA